MTQVETGGGTEERQGAPSDTFFFFKGLLPKYSAFMMHLSWFSWTKMGVLVVSAPPPGPEESCWSLSTTPPPSTLVLCPSEGLTQNNVNWYRKGRFHPSSPFLSPLLAPPSEALCTLWCLLYYVRVGGGVGAGSCSLVKIWNNASPVERGIHGQKCTKGIIKEITHEVHTGSVPILQMWKLGHRGTK